MASYRATRGVLLALKDQLAQRISRLLNTTINVEILGSRNLATVSQPDALGIYLHRIAISPFGRNQYFSPSGKNQAHKPELQVNLYVLLIGWSNKADLEIDYISAAMQVIGSALALDVSHLALADPLWGEADSVQVIPEEMSTEDLMRIWDSLPGDYQLSCPYIIKTIRLQADHEQTEAPLVDSLLFQYQTKTKEMP